ncbi:MAG: hypothetical protein IJI11_02355, partial [Mogibacterium sp.]|nr:hypothetical protein [Mogibacterium sp.]
MTDFELTPEEITKETSEQIQQVAEQASQVSAQAAAVSMAPVFDFDEDEKVIEKEEEKDNSLSQFTPDEQRQIRAVAEKIDIT